MAKTQEQIDKEEKEQELRLMFREIFVCFGTAMRHTMINHKQKSEKAWRELGDRVWDFGKALEE